ncbi:MAG: helix-turn-helix domain-containing protein [Oligoflexales bacterium]
MTCVSIGEAALVLGVSISTLRRWDRSQALMLGYRTSGGHRRYTWEQLMSFMGRPILKKDGFSKKNSKISLLYSSYNSL